MLSFRPQQLHQIARAHFVDRAVQHMRRNHRDFAELDPKLTRAFVEDTVEEAANRYGLTKQRTIMTYLLVAWFVGPEFTEEHPEAESILRDERASETDRASLLYRWAWNLLGKEAA